MPVSPPYRPDPRWLSLGDGFHDAVEAARFPQRVLRYRNQAAAATVGLEGLTDAEWLDHFGRFVPLPGNLTEPLALRYHGHQFRSYNPDIGDGRGFLFAQLRDDRGRLLDLGTKGSGQTPYSRFGDGRLTLKGGVREVLATELLEARGVNTSKTFSLIETGEALERHDEPSPTRSSVLVRLSHGHVRIGTFQRLAAYHDTARTQKLVDYVVETHYPALAIHEGPARVVALFTAVVDQVARTCAAWMAAGFVHGVLNTDNINVTGESFDYGPWRFLPTYEPGFTAAYFDHTGLYAFGRQPGAVQWNLARLAETLLDIADRDQLVAALDDFARVFDRHAVHHVFARLGLVASDDHAENTAFLQAWFGFLNETKVGFEQTFHDWWGGTASADRAAASPQAAAYASAAFDDVRDRLNRFSPRAPERLALAHFQRPQPCDMVIDEVEAIFKPIAEADDWSVFHHKLGLIADMKQAVKFASNTEH
jgi:serine/tyrosine/threonine adenylyltransferase